jgi:hypothetical protein
MSLSKLSNPKLSKYVKGDETKSILESIVGDLADFEQRVNKLLEAHEQIMIDHYEQLGVVHAVSKIERPEDLEKFDLQILPTNIMNIIAREVGKHNKDYNLPSQTLLYSEVMRQMLRAGQAYINECLRQRMQVLLNPSRIIKPSSKIILPNG